MNATGRYQSSARVAIAAALAVAAAVVVVLTIGSSLGDDESRRGKVEPVHVDFDYCRMKFVVHRRFAEHFDGLNSSRPTTQASNVR